MVLSYLYLTLTFFILLPAMVSAFISLPAAVKLADYKIAFTKSILMSSITPNPVMGKIDCMFDREVSNEPTKKSGRSGAQFLAVPRLDRNFEALMTARIAYTVTGKIDGTCTFVKEGIEHCELFKRRDLKDISNPPANWFQTADEFNGHFIGFMPLESGDPHLMCHPLKDNIEPTARNLKNPDSYDLNRVRALRQGEDGTLQIQIIPTESLNGRTVEVVGPKLNNNPHGLEFHCVFPHGEIQIPTDQFPHLCNYSATAETESQILDEIKEWFQRSKIGIFLEGIVIHFEKGQMFKLHREHLGLPWAKGYSAPPLISLRLD